MKDLLQCEIKKFLHPLAHRIIIICLGVFPMLFLFAFHYSDQRNQTIFDGQWVSLTTQKQLADEIRKDLAGVIDETWLLKTENMLASLEESEIQKNDMKYQTISNAYWYGVHAYENWYSTLNNVETPELVKTDLKEHLPIYGPYEGWLSYMEIFKYCALVYILSCLYLFSDLFNQEDSVGMVDLLKSSKYGRKPLAIAKILTALIMSLILEIVMYGVLNFGASWILNLQGGSTTYLMKEGIFQIYTFDELQQQAFLLMLYGGIICSMIGAFLSVRLKKPFVSLAGSILFYLFPTLISISFFNTNWNVLCPSNFLNFQSFNQLMTFSWVRISNQFYHRLLAIGLIWLFILLILIICIFWLHCRDKKNYILKGWR